MNKILFGWVIPIIIYILCDVYFTHHGVILIDILIIQIIAMTTIKISDFGIKL